MWLCILADKQVEDSFENTQWSVLAHFQVPKNCTSVAEIKKKTETNFSCQHPPKMGDYMFVLCILLFWVSFKANFQKSHIFISVYIFAKRKETKNGNHF